MIFVTRHSKARKCTNQEFLFARYLRRMVHSLWQPISSTCDHLRSRFIDLRLSQKGNEHCFSAALMRLKSPGHPPNEHRP